MSKLKTKEKGFFLQVVAQVERGELGEASVRCRDASGKLVGAEVEGHQVLQVAQLGRHRSGQLLHAAQAQVGEGTQLAQLRRDCACTCQTSLRIAIVNFELLSFSVPSSLSPPGNLVRAIVEVGQAISLACVFLFGDGEAHCHPHLMLLPGLDHYIRDEHLLPCHEL